MAHYGTAFVQTLSGAGSAQSHSSSIVARPLTEAQRRMKLRSRLDQRLRWYLHHNEWQQALVLVQRQLQGRVHKRHKNALDGVVTPHQFKMLLGDPEAGVSATAAAAAPAQHLLEYVREGCATDEIPNSPGLYRALVDGYCRANFPASAVEAAVEGNARWRFAPQLREDMTAAVLRACARIREEHAASVELRGRVWQTALDCVNDVLLAGDRNNSNSSSAGSRVVLRNEPLLRDLVAQCAPQQKPQARDAQHGASETVQQTDADAWSACVAAAETGDWQAALALFETAVADASAEVDLRAVHALLNALGGGGQWQNSVRVAQTLAARTGAVDATSCDLVFAAFPRPACFVQQQQPQSGGGAESVPSESATEAIALFEKWMCELETFSPPPLTCAVVTGFYADVACSNRDSGGGDPDWIHSCFTLLCSFALQTDASSSSPASSRRAEAVMDAVSHAAVLRALDVLLVAAERRNKEKADGDNDGVVERMKAKVKQLTFPVAGSEQLAALKRLNAYREQRWAARAASSDDTAAACGTRPTRTDYFPAKRSGSVLAIPSAEFDDEAERKAALDHARLLGEQTEFAAHAFAAGGGAGRMEPRDRNAMRHVRPGQRTPFDDPRRAPVDQNDPASGYNYFGVGGKPVLPGKNRLATVGSMRPKRMPGLHDPDRSWRNSTPRAIMRKTPYAKYGKPI